MIPSNMVSPAVGSENVMSMISVYTGDKCCIEMFRYQLLHTGVPMQAYTRQMRRASGMLQRVQTI